MNKETCLVLAEPMILRLNYEIPTTCYLYGALHDLRFQELIIHYGNEAKCKQLSL